MVTRMHALEVIIRRNAEAAGRECAHADNDGEVALSERIDREASLGARAFKRGYTRGLEEG